MKDLSKRLSSLVKEVAILPALIVVTIILLIFWRPPEFDDKYDE
jgi:hypothetical protein